MLVVPFARRRILGVVVDVAEHSDVPPDKLAEPLSALEADVPPELVNLGLWVAREYVSTPARGLALVLPPGHGHRERAPDRAAAVAAGGRSPPRAARRWRATRAWEPASVPPSRRSRPGPRGSATWPSATGCDHAGARRLEGRGLRGAGVRRPGPGRPRTSMVGARPDVRALTAPRRARWARWWRPWTRPPAPTGACCCTGSPAAARPRSTSAPWPRPSSAAAPPSCWCPRSR